MVIFKATSRRHILFFDNRTFTLFFLGCIVFLERLVCSIRSSACIDNSSRRKHSPHFVKDNILCETLAELVRANKDVLGIFNFTKEVLFHQILFLLIKREQVLVY